MIQIEIKFLKKALFILTGLLFLHFLFNQNLIYVITLDNNVILKWTEFEFQEVLSSNDSFGKIDLFKKTEMKFWSIIPYQFRYLFYLSYFFLTITVVYKISLKD